MKAKKKWYDYLWIVSSVYLILGFVNILFAWIGLICFFVPLGISLFKGNKSYCNKYCGRGQLFDLLGNKLNLSRKKDIPGFLRSTWFRYGFLTFFLTMFINMLFLTYLVFAERNGMKEIVNYCGPLSCLGILLIMEHYLLRGLHNLHLDFTALC